MMTTEEKRRLWLEEFTREFAKQCDADTEARYTDSDYATWAATSAKVVMEHASRLMPDFAEPEREFDRQAAAEQLRSYLVNYHGTYRDLAIDIIDGKIPGVKYTPPTSTPA